MQTLVVIPLQTRGFYNSQRILWKWDTVVIPLLTRGFYNLALPQVLRRRESCHTPPNERLLQLNDFIRTNVLHGLSYPSKREASTTCRRWFGAGLRTVVIPLQTRGFYNIMKKISVAVLLCCHTPPNERLLQLSGEKIISSDFSLSYPSKREASTTKNDWDWETYK